jgi:hypothetical protein
MEQTLMPVKHCGARFLQHLAIFCFAADKTVGHVALDEKPSKSIVDVYAAAIERPA